MSWIFVADDGERVHYDVPPQVAQLEAKLERQREIAELLLKPDLRVDDVWTFQERWAALEGEQDG